MSGVYRMRKHGASDERRFKLDYTDTDTSQCGHKVAMTEHCETCKGLEGSIFGEQVSDPKSGLTIHVGTKVTEQLEQQIGDVLADARWLRLDSLAGFARTPDGEAVQIPWQHGVELCRLHDANATGAEHDKERRLELMEKYFGPGYDRLNPENKDHGEVPRTRRHAFACANWSVLVSEDETTLIIRNKSTELVPGIAVVPQSANVVHVIQVDPEDFPASV